MQPVLKARKAGPQGPKGDTGETGATGASGPQGPAGPGIASGGTTGQILAKASNTDYDTEWINAGGGGGDTIQVIDLPLGDNNNTRTITFVTPPKFIKLFNTTYDNWTSEASFYWGQPIIAYHGASGSAPAGNGYTASSRLTYSGNSVTINGINGLGAFNNNTGFQKMVIFGGEYNAT